jgi:transposase
VHVADKGLNCAENIAFAKKNGDGYLFSKSVKQLPEKEKAWVLISDGFTVVRNKAGKELYRYKSCVDKFPYTFIHEGKKVTVQVTEKRLLTFNPDLAAKKRYEINKMAEKAKYLTLSQAKKSDYGESSKYVNFTDKAGGKAIVSINRDAIEKDLDLAGYNLLVTSETNMTDEDIYAAYHNLWRIEESFRIMKSDLDARPAFVQKENAIKGHFLICYITVLLERLFQFKILEDAFGAREIFGFIKCFRVTHAEPKCINVAADSPFVKYLSELTKLPLRSFYLSNSQIQSILKCKLPLPLPSAN